MTPRNDMPDRLDRARAVLVVVDIQERFRDVIVGMDGVLAASGRLVQYCQQLGIPVLVTEHYPRGLGVTLPELRETIRPFAPIEKIHFSCAGDEGFREALAATGRDQVLLCGIETHVCIYQTACDLLRDGKRAVVAVDAVSSCTNVDRSVGLQRLDRLGADLMTVQMIMFEILVKAGTSDFKAVASLLKG